MKPLIESQSLDMIYDLFTPYLGHHPIPLLAAGPGLNVAPLAILNIAQLVPLNFAWEMLRAAASHLKLRAPAMDLSSSIS